jgi:hypothetical protein
MGLNIVAERKMSLKGFAEGWDDCYVIVRSANEAKRKQWLAALGTEANEEVAVQVTRDACLDSIVRGVVMSTDENGKATATSFDASDVPDVVEALNFAWQQEILSVATGADRLKARMI